MRRLPHYNTAIVAALILGFIAYVGVLGRYQSVICQPIVDAEGKVLGYDAEIGGVALLGPVIGGTFALCVANFCYLLGPVVEHFVRPASRAVYRKWCWRAGTAFACIMPFGIAAMHLFLCWFYPNAYDHTPIVVG